tara:strand:+ start:15524 stop:15697 length:174 start_codon:yes stop_codon:yes gene_type:complete
VNSAAGLWVRGVFRVATGTVIKPPDPCNADETPASHFGHAILTNPSPDWKKTVVGAG